MLAGEICDTILEVLRDGTDDNMPYIFPNVQFRVTNKHHMSGSTDEKNFLNAPKNYSNPDESYISYMQFGSQ